MEIVADGKPMKCAKHDEWNCCGDPYKKDLLSFDHIAGDGAKDRKAGIARTVRWIINNPKVARRKFQLLCMNAQIIKMRRNNETTLIK